MVTPLIKGSQSHRLCASPSWVTRCVSARAARMKVQKEEEEGLVGTRGAGGTGPRRPHGDPGKGQASGSAAHLSLPRAMLSILATWLNWHPEDFFQPPGFPCLKMLVAYLGLNFPASDLENQAQLFLSELEDTEPAQGDAEGEGDLEG